MQGLRQSLRFDACRRISREVDEENGGLTDHGFGICRRDIRRGIYAVFPQDYKVAFHGPAIFASPITFDFSFPPTLHVSRRQTEDASLPRADDEKCVIREVE